MPKASKPPAFFVRFQGEPKILCESDSQTAAAEAARRWTNASGGVTEVCERRYEIRYDWTTGGHETVPASPNVVLVVKPRRRIKL